MIKAMAIGKFALLQQRYAMRARCLSAAECLYAPAEPPRCFALG